MQENNQTLDSPIEDEEPFRAAVLNFLEGNCERVNESESSLEDDPERVKECRNFQKELFNLLEFNIFIFRYITALNFKP